ncbi:hypothetical protein [Mucilaginibacter gotjawali]|uniref:Uncharacterized protein n=2 Tax=Mucilaginibacter gotjawali TaxID=1550579 RepID=A0A120MYM7_9SPHI|nr:hypothetical protein [Mucilaginibacter gotjawali]MBB3055482.1 hypothetical protein [Mucilaginibacter gotjawali]BAU53239.1 hypothetical protein MgSA37_01406 [Mucilaginibacter gotjawali]
MKISQIPLLVIFCLLLTACKKSIPVKPTVFDSSNADIYVVGETQLPNGKVMGTLWKNGVARLLTDTSVQSFANDIAVNGSDVYVTGAILHANHYVQAVYWKNGMPNLLSDTTGDYDANSISINGTNVYITINEHFVNGTYIARHWVNKAPGLVVDSSQFYYETAMMANNADVYLVGFNLKKMGDTSAFNISYSKNGIITKLQQGSFPSDAVVNGDDLYIAGTIYAASAYYSTAAYWKNGVKVNLTDGKSTAYAFAIAVSGADVYTAGGINANPGPSTIPVAVYWKNTTVVPLRGSSDPNGAGGIAVSGTDVYVTGAISGCPGYWKNGVPVILGSEGYASRIVVVPH